ncbi:MAG: NADH-quinone oxidoreductase subunit NuoH [Candidatus Zhuqueibacterota bacterium]
MKELFLSLSESWKLNPAQMTLVTVLWLLVVSILVLVFMALFAGITSWAERRIAGRMMSRIGPNRVGPVGFLQWLADGLKSFLKEDVIPAASDRLMFRFAPYVVFTGAFGAFAALPFGYGIAATHIDIGIVYVTAIATLTVLGIMMAGWSSNNKWSLIGGIRSAAQIVSYEIPSGLAVMSIVVIAGSLNMEEIIKQQGGWPWHWFIFHNPFTFIAFFIFFASILAEGNRTPFDLPEAESELVAGYLTEYSGMRFVFFFFAEWANLWVMSALVTTLFLGGWQIPGISDLGAMLATATFPIKALWVLLSLVVFCTKTLILVFVVIWIRWTLPRLRVDQLMVMCWKYFTPIGFVALLGSALFSIMPHSGAWLYFHWAVKIGLTALGFTIVLMLLLRSAYNLRKSKDEIDLKIWI